MIGELALVFTVGNALAQPFAARPVHVIVPCSTVSLNEKNVHQFAPVTLVPALPYVIATNPKVPAANVRELIEHA